MFDKYLQSILNRSEKYISYATNLCNYVASSLEKELPLYATHSHCTDGGTAGAMIRYAVPEAAIIPMDYWMINDPNFTPLIEQIPWTGIVDLKPFNKQIIDFWVDHHISARNSVVNANRIRFDMDGDSGSYQLLLSSFLGSLPQHLVELAVMTRTTDTAGYTTQPPTTIIDDLSDLDLIELTGEEGKIQNEQRIWLLDDAWGSTYTLKEHLNLHNYLAKDGFYGISKVLDRVNNLRKGRQEAYDIADDIAVFPIVAFSFAEDSQDKFTILRRLQTNGVKVAISLNLTKEGTVKISFRRNRFLSETENDKIQVQKIAEKLNGGGHPGAAGASAENLASALDFISAWAAEIDLEFHHVEL